MSKKTSVIITENGKGGFTVRVKLSHKRKLTPEELQNHLRIRKSAFISKNAKHDAKLMRKQKYSKLY